MQNKSSRFESSKTILITGASSGIGETTAKHFDQLGFKVYAGVRNDKDASRIEKNSRNITAVILDVTQKKHIHQTKALLELELEGHGLDALVNNAGIALAGPLESLSLDDLQKQFDINIMGAISMIQAFLPQLRNAKGNIINISSTSAMVALPFGSAYAASKFALEGLSDALRIELKQFGISVSLIVPGSVKTAIWDKHDANLSDFLDKMSNDTNKHYGKNILTQQALIKRVSSKGIHPDVVAKTIEKAIKSQKPKARYLVGPSARVQWFMKTILPTRWFDTLKYKMLISQ